MKLVVTLAGIPIGLEISNATYRFVFEPYITPDRAPVAWIHVPEADLSAARPLYGRESSAAYVEYMELCPQQIDGSHQQQQGRNLTQRTGDRTEKDILIIDRRMRHQLRFDGCQRRRKNHAVYPVETTVRRGCPDTERRQTNPAF